MRAITKLLGAVAAVAIASAAATSASAAIMLPFGGFSVSGITTYTGDVAGPNTGSIDITSPSGFGAFNSVFNFDPGITGNPLIGLAELTQFSMHAVTDQLATGGMNPGDLVEQRGFHGGFQFIFSGLGATPLPPCLGGTCTNILSGVFTGGVLLGHQDSVHAEVSAGTQLAFQTLTLTSDFFDFSGYNGRSFSITYDPVTPPLHRNANGLINNFASTSAGVVGVGIPEPSTWGLMILGFGGAGAMLRARRRQAVAA